MSFIDDKEILIDKSSFLLKKGYILEDIDEYGLTYQSKKIRIDIGYGRYGDLSGINILFKKKLTPLMLLGLHSLWIIIKFLMKI